MGRPYRFTYTNQNGAYVLTDISPGTYYVYAERNDYVGAMYGGITCPGGICDPTTGNPVLVLPGQTSSGIDIALNPGGRIRGTLRDEAAQPIRDGWVYTLVYNGANQTVGYGYTDDTGRYITSALPDGTYFVVAVPLSLYAPSAYIPELYREMSPCFLGDPEGPPSPCDPSTGTSVTVAAGSITPNIDFTLATGGQIQGFIRDVVTRRGFYRARVDIYNDTHQLLAVAYADITGTYRTSGLPAGTYYVVTRNGRDYVDELFNDQPCLNGSCTPGTGTPVTVATGTITSGIDFDLGTLHLVRLHVDENATPQTSSNLNGVLEPGETVQVAPELVNRSPADLSASGTVTTVVGPSGATYTIVDDTATYGTVPAGATGNCLNQNDCYILQVSDPAVRPVDHWDIVIQENLQPLGTRAYVVHVGASFSDVSPAFVLYPHIETMFHYGITGGCGGGRYCPMQTTNRGQMAIFISLAPDGTQPPVQYTDPGTGRSYDCADGLANFFADVPDSVSYCRHVHYLWARGITGGCGPGVYCPFQTVNRAQMAVFIARAVLGSSPPASYTDPDTARSYNCTDGLPNHFTDVPDSVFYCPHVHYLWARGVIAGCTRTAYCPLNPVLRAQMAAFMVNGFGLRLYGP